MTATLAAVIRRVESSDGDAIMRFEPACYEAVRTGMAGGYALHPHEILDAIMTANRCSIPTAQAIFATSWGDYQAMGFTLYGDWCVAPAHVPSIREWLADQDLQDRAFAAWCKRHGFDATDPLPSDPEILRFARIYNGPGAVDAYAARMKAAAVAITQARKDPEQ